MENRSLELDDVLRELEAMERTWPASALVIYRPDEEQQSLLRRLCEFYLQATPDERARIRTAVSAQQGVPNRLLGYVYEAARQLRATADRQWLRLGLAAASIEDCRFDYRDFLLAVSELYVAAEETGIHPRATFQKVARMSSTQTPRGGMTPVSEMLSHLSSYGALKERRKRSQTAG